MKALTEQQEKRIAALKRVVAAATIGAGRITVYGAALLGLAAVFPELQLPSALSAIGGELGVEAMGILLDRVASGRLSTDEITEAVESAINNSEVKNILTKDEFYQAFVQLRRGQRLQSRQTQTLEGVVKTEFERLYPVLEQIIESASPAEELKSETRIQQEAQLRRKLEQAVRSPVDGEEDIASLVQQAEELATGELPEEAADLYAQSVSVLIGMKRPVQAREYANRAKEQYLAAGKKQPAVEALIKGAEAWIEHTTYEPAIIGRDLEEATKLADEIGSFTLHAHALVLQAELALTTGDLDEAESFWEKAAQILLKVPGKSQIGLYCELALQRAMRVRLDEGHEEAIRILQEADERDWPATSHKRRLELLWVLMFVQAEVGDWAAVDQVYQRVQKKLSVQSDKLQSGKWLMHYAATLARRGSADEAYQAYTEALDKLESSGAPAQLKHHLHQDMVRVLSQHAGFEAFGPVLGYESRRLDLALNVLHETKNAQHRERARQRYLQGDLESAMQYGQSALALAWRKGSWSSMAQAYRDLAFLYAANEQPMEAMFAAIRAGNDKMGREYAEQAASIADKAHSQQAVAELLSHGPSLPEQCSALVGLTYSADIISSDFLSPATDFALDVLAQSSQQSAGREARRRAAELLHELAPRLNRAHTNRVLQVCVDRLPEARPLLNQMELLRVIGACFENKHAVDVSLTESVLRTLLSLRDSDALRNEFEAALLQLGRNSSGTERAQVVAYFRQQSDWIRLAALGEPVPEEEVRATIEKVLASNTPRWEKGSISYGGWRAQSITSFNEILSTSLHALVVDGLLEAATNADGFANQRSETIRTLRWLPEEAIRERADRIAVILFGICDNVDNENESDKGVRNFLGGPSNQLLQSSLYTLGHLYEWSSAEIRQRTLERVLSSSDHNDVLVRTGAAMALRRTKGSEPLPFQIVMAHERLLADHEAAVRHWAGAATGHLIIQPLLSEQHAGYFAERLAKLVLSEEDSFARSGMAYGLRVIADNQEDSLPESVSYALEQLANDVSFRVRHMAKPKREEG